ncbi:MAG: YHS domain-containing protein [bacterium]|nr:YHS domain-containing protein [bacterium]
MVKCAVCESSVEEDDLPIFSEYGGRQYYFCSVGCREEFEYDQEKYLKNLDKEENSREVATDDGAGNLG